MTPLIAAKPRPPLIVFTDLDGTLLDAHTYEVGPVHQMLARLAAQRIPVVFCSSKTAAEQRPLRGALGLEHTPYIVENGSAVFVPDSAGLGVTDWPRVAGVPHERVRVLGQTFDVVRAGLARATAKTGSRVAGFADLSSRQVAELTGLDEASASRARQRDFSETLIDQCSPEEWSALEVALAAEGLTCRHGGRFRTVSGAESDKGRAARLVAGLFTVARGQPIITAGLGDSANDEGLLASVDHPYLIAQAERSWASIDIPGLVRTPQAGPSGWNEAIQHLLATRQA
jgi:mannosyl-3-phosphoglycerate phosphatase family protein